MQGKQLVKSGKHEPMTTEATRVHVFVYGTLKPGERYYQRYCADSVVAECVAIATGQLYHLPREGYPAMTHGDNWVQGYRLSFKQADILTALDSLEDYDPNNAPNDNEYQRQEIEIFDQYHHSLGQAWAYFMTAEQVASWGGIYLPDGIWSSDQF